MHSQPGTYTHMERMGTSVRGIATDLLKGDAIQHARSSTIGLSKRADIESAYTSTDEQVITTLAPLEE